MSTPYPPLRPFARHDLFAATGPESMAFDAQAIEEIGVPQPVLMENAGRSAAAILDRLYPDGPVLGLVGAGNNGGDALVLLRTLSAWGREVRAVVVADRDLQDPLLHGWSVPVVRDGEVDDAIWSSWTSEAAVLVDGILGTGARGAPRERQAEAIRRVNSAAQPVLAIDVPSGVDATSGGVAGEAVRADVTVAFGVPKLGCLLHPARAHVGRHVAVEIGFPPLAASDFGARVVTPGWAQSLLPSRSTDTHKNAVGRVLVVAGGVGMAGAAVLAARGAFRSGAGLVRVCSVPENREVIQSSVPEAIFVDLTDRDALTLAWSMADAVAVGPGLGTGEGGRAAVEFVTQAAALPTLLDADALNLGAQGGFDLAALAASRPVLITPHAGEMARLNSGDPAASRVEVARDAAARFGCAVLFKGAPSLVAVGGSPVLVDTQSASDLAVAGMGDALTGVCVGLMAQGLAPADAAAVGLYLSGRAAGLAGRGAALTPSDVLRWLPEALQERGDGVSNLDLPFVIFDADPAR